MKNGFTFNYVNNTARIWESIWNVSQMRQIVYTTY